VSRGNTVADTPPCALILTFEIQLSPSCGQCRGVSGLSITSRTRRAQRVVFARGAGMVDALVAAQGRSS
jgi:hypothetical protein